MRIPVIRESGTAVQPNSVDADAAATQDAAALTESTGPEFTAQGVTQAPLDAVPLSNASALYAMRPAAERRLRRAIAIGQPVPGAPATPVAQATAPRAAAAEAAVLERLRFSLTEWVDEEKARAYANRPSDLLRAVAKQRHRIIPDAFTKTLDPSLLADEAVLDEASVLFDRLQRREQAQGEPTDGTASLSSLRTTFIDALRADYAKRRALDALFAPTPALGQTTPYFDGFALRNAEGKSFDDLVDLENVSTDPAFRLLTKAQRRALLTEKFDEMGESMQYPIGSIPHSLATALLRIDRYRGVAPSEHGNEAQIVKAFIDSERKGNSGESYPYSPRLLFGMHLARSSGLEVLSYDQLRLVYENQISDPALEALWKGDDKPAERIGRYLSRWDNGRVSWKERGTLTQVQALLGLIEVLRTAADEEGPVGTFARQLREKGVLTPNRIVGADVSARATAVIEYANERLLAAYGKPPAFDRREAATAILRRNGLDAQALSETRHYVISGDNPNVTKAAFGDVVDEFLDRADWVGLNGSSMTPRAGVWLKPRDELQREEEAFNERLPSDPWVVATAKERLRAQSKAVTDEAVQSMANEIASHVATETESHRALVRGVETWINTVPVAGPIYNIEEGVRHRDAARAAFGLLFLGLDVFDLSMSGGGGRGARTQSVHPIVPKLRRVTARVDGSAVSLAGHPETIEMTVDPVHIARPDSGVPEELRALARQARGGSRVRWRDYDVVHLDEEDRIVPVKRSGDGYIEIDWRTGHRLRDAPAIDLDAQTGKGSARRARLGGTDGERVRGTEVRSRLTVEGVTGLLTRADDATLRDFDGLFADAFALPPPIADSSQFDAPVFYRRLYESSSTFRRLANRHAQLDGHARNSTASPWKKWEFVIGEAGPLGSPRKAYTDFDHKRIYMPKDADIEEMPYMSAAGQETVTREQVYLHEMVHALTGARDPERSLDMLNRGPVVYLTDKILSEAGYEIPEQIMYRRQNSLPDMPADQTVEHHMPAAAQAAHQENRYLDPLVDAKRGAVTADTLVEGTPVASRLTVARTKAVLDGIDGEEDDVFLAHEDFEAKFRKNFGFYVQDRAMTTTLASDALVVMDFYGRLYRRSGTFRRLFDKMPVTGATQADPWKFVLDGETALAELPPGRLAHSLNPATKKIYLFDDGTRYLTQAGLRDVEIERKLAYEMICAMTGLGNLSSTQAYANRGAAVFLTDRILKEASFNYPRQLAAALAGPADAASETRLLANQTSAMRSAAIEDRYLQST